MKGKFKTIISNFSYTFASNIISTLIATLILIIVPKLIGVSEYGYWQLYIFYTSYLGFFNLGWVEGIYLRYGGEEYHKLDRNLFSSQFWSFFVYIFLDSCIIAMYSSFWITDFNKLFIFQMVSICLIISAPRGFLLYILQSTNRIKEYSKLTILDRIIYSIIIFLMLLMGIKEYKLLIIADLIGKIVTLICTIYICKEIVFSRMVTLKDNVKEIKANISVGIKLLFANIAGMLIIGVVRLGIERYWDVKTFGKVSFTLSISNLMMLFINAVGIVIFPILRRTDEKKLSSIYITIRDFLMVVLLGGLLVYYPLKIILSIWLPTYNDSLMYMAIIFPMCVFEGKMALLINTYLKTMRKEKIMLTINLISLMLSLIMTFVSTALLCNLNLAIFSIVICLAFRCVFTELYLSIYLKISLYKDIALELSMVLIFILTGWFVNSWLTFLFYIVAYIIYLAIKKKDITKTIINVKLLMKE